MQNANSLRSNQLMALTYYSSYKNYEKFVVDFQEESCKKLDKEI